jgi:hypothetical protein
VEGRRKDSVDESGGIKMFCLIYVHFFFKAFEGCDAI